MLDFHFQPHRLTMASGGKSIDWLPNDIEAEQAVLGSLLYDNAAMASMPTGFGPEAFYEPFHQRLFQRISARIGRGELADPITLMASFQSDPAWEEVGGIRYLADLVDRAPPVAGAVDYARSVSDAYVRRRLIWTAREVISAVEEGTLPSDEIRAALERDLGDMANAGDTLQLIEADDAMERVLDYIDNPGAHASGIFTGLTSLDEHLGPLLPGDLILIGGRPGMGKSAIAGIISRNVAQQVGGVIEIHAEMSVEQAWRRRLTATAYEIETSTAPAYSAIRKRRIEYAQREALGVARERLRGIPLKALKRTGITLGRLRMIVRHQRALWDRKGVPLAALVIDHVGLIKSDREHNSRVDQQTEISNGLKELAGDLEVPIIALAQLNRKLEDRDDKRPTLPDLRDSGSWEQDADIVIGAYREAYYARLEKQPKDNTAAEQIKWADWDARRKSPWIEAILLKVREGETGMAKLWANMPTNTILGAAPQDDGLFSGGN